MLQKACLAKTGDFSTAFGDPVAHLAFSLHLRPYASLNRHTVEETETPKWVVGGIALRQRGTCAKWCQRVRPH